MSSKMSVIEFARGQCAGHRIMIDESGQAHTEHHDAQAEWAVTALGGEPSECARMLQWLAGHTDPSMPEIIGRMTTASLPAVADAIRRMARPTVDLDGDWKPRRDPTLIEARLARVAVDATGRAAWCIYSIPHQLAWPIAKGRYAHYRTRGGEYISHPTAYARRGWSNMVYCSSTRRTLVGEHWLAYLAARGLDISMTRRGKIVMTYRGTAADAVAIVEEMREADTASSLRIDIIDAMAATCGEDLCGVVQPEKDGVAIVRDPAGRHHAIDGYAARDYGKPHDA